MLTEKERSFSQAAYRDAYSKVADLPARLQDEAQQAAAEHRAECPIEPLTGISAALLIKVMAEISGASGELADIIGSQRRACRDLGDRTVYLLSEQLLAILKAAGLGGANANV